MRKRQSDQEKTNEFCHPTREVVVIKYLILLRTIVSLKREIKYILLVVLAAIVAVVIIFIRDAFTIVGVA